MANENIKQFEVVLPDTEASLTLIKLDKKIANLNRVIEKVASAGSNDTAADNKIDLLSDKVADYEIRKDIVISQVTNEYPQQIIPAEILGSTVEMLYHYESNRIICAYDEIKAEEIKAQNETEKSDEDSEEEVSEDNTEESVITDPDNVEQVHIEDEIE